MATKYYIECFSEQQKQTNEKEKNRRKENPEYKTKQKYYYIGKNLQIKTDVYRSKVGA